MIGDKVFLNVPSADILCFTRLRRRQFAIQMLIEFGNVLLNQILGIFDNFDLMMKEDFWPNSTISAFRSEILLCRETCLPSISSRVRVYWKEQGVEWPEARRGWGRPSPEKIFEFANKNAGFLCIFIAKKLLVARNRYRLLNGLIGPLLEG